MAFRLLIIQVAYSLRWYVSPRFRVFFFRPRTSSSMNLSASVPDRFVFFDLLFALVVPPPVKASRLLPLSSGHECYSRPTAALQIRVRAPLFATTPVSAGHPISIRTSTASTPVHFLSPACWLSIWPLPQLAAGNAPGSVLCRFGRSHQIHIITILGCPPSITCTSQHTHYAGGIVINITIVSDAKGPVQFGPSVDL